MQIHYSAKSKYENKIFIQTKTQAEKISFFSGDYKECVVFYKKNGAHIHVGLGDVAGVTEERLRQAMAVGLREAQRLKLKEVSCESPKGLTIAASRIAAVIAESAVMTTYRFDKYRTDVKKDKHIKAVELVLNAADAIKAAQEAVVIAQGTCYTRDLVNELAHVMTPEQLAKEALALAKAKVCEVTILDEKQIAKEGLGLLQAVGQGSPYPPRLILLHYKGDSASSEVKAIVGKGVTFDTGGIHLKPSGSIETMKQDMAGAAVVLGVMKTAIALKLKVNLVGAIPAAYNAVDGTAYIPGDIYKSYLGKTVEIKNTDAEGRLILADALAYVHKNKKPSCIVDVATLTGAISVCLGDIASGLFSNDDALADSLFQAGEATWERLWRLPLYEEYCEAMKGDVADLNNLSSLGRGQAGSITGAAFLKEFIGNTPWAHLDIAATAYNEKGAKGYIPKYGTGFGVRLLVQWLKTAELS